MCAKNKGYIMGSSEDRWRLSMAGNQRPRNSAVTHPGEPEEETPPRRGSMRMTCVSCLVDKEHMIHCKRDTGLVSLMRKAGF